MTKVITGLRPGGRSARIQAAVHNAVQTLQHNVAVADLTIPMIAEYAGVTSSTIYRRWGDLSQLLADVAFNILHPDNVPADLGSFKQDLYAWMEQYFEEYASPVGRTILSDIVAENDSPTSGKCYDFLIQQLDIIQQRAQQRNETSIDNQLIIEIVIAPMLHRILFTEQESSLDYIHHLLARLFNFADVLKNTTSDFES
ncbi:TetR/AcrR family transcriptional regulator [Acinetobacter sp. ETR1]|uniref:TetR/AcrR family transcriptional regulator n=1 Tax=Acinetobacter sp. ETR1 TaxID=1485002 RepID=UPI0004D5285E|nr:TetR/AcrR family transcriptional regulator [Acinetobacter sp. ETR1]KEC86004.1 TetR family transcriptional regulator [Acinetobacter sp. ETR1]